MTEKKVPVKHYRHLAKRFPKSIAALENMGSAIHEEGPIQGKTAELIQLAGAASIQSEGSVHSHTRRAIEAGATADEIYHTLLLLISTIGFPRASAAMRWAQDILAGKEKK